MSRIIDSSSIAKRRAVDAKIAPQDAYHHQYSAMQCPHCYGSGNSHLMGELVVDGCARPVLHCQSCNKLYSDMPAAVKVLMDAAVQGGAEQVGFRPADVNSITNADNLEAQEANRKLDQVNTNLMTMNGTICSLMDQVRVLAEQNHKLMEQLATDPLVGIRKRVSEFDLS